MFFVTLLLNEVISWMRRQSGTSSLRAILYMDEIFGYFPPTAMPPSKTPMLTLLKQARAFGLGVVLATQNPVDIDYKGLANCGTWFIGKLQTERDKARVIEGLQVASNGEINAGSLDQMIASIGSRTFLMRSIHHKDPVLFQTRWTLSYLRGPLTLAQISTLTEKSDQEPPLSEPSPQEKGAISGSKSTIPPGIPEFFAGGPARQQPLQYKPQVAGFAKLHFVDAKNNIDTWQDLCILSPVDDDGKNVRWEEGKNISDLKNQLEKTPLPNSSFENVPSGLLQEKNYAAFAKSLLASLYQNQTLTIFRAPDLGLTSRAGEAEGDFRASIDLASREKRDELIKKLRDKYADKISQLSEKLRRAQEKASQKQQQAGMQKAETMISVGTTLLGALFGKGLTKGTISQVGTSMRRAGKIEKGSQAATDAEVDVSTYQQQLDDLLSEQQSQIAALTDINNVKIETITVRPRKSDISVEKVALIWCSDEALKT